MKYLVRARVYSTTGFLPDLIGEEQKIVVQAHSRAEARGIVEKQIVEMRSYVSVKEIAEIA